MVKGRTTGEESEVPREFAEAVPRELYTTSDIRFVMRETATLAERIEGLTKSIDKLGPSFEKALDRHAADSKERFAELKADVKESGGKVEEFERKVAFVRGALWVLGGLFAIAVVLLGVIAKALLD